MKDCYKEFIYTAGNESPQMTAAMMKDNPNLWKEFYPHKSFVKYLKDTLNVIERRSGKSLGINVEGAYGTGKSHAALTVKRILEAPMEEVREYFQKYSRELDDDLLGRVEAVKRKKILTVYQYGSSSIRDDRDLVSAVRNGVAEALVEHGFENKAGQSLTQSWIDVLNSPLAVSIDLFLQQPQFQDLLQYNNSAEIKESLIKYLNEAREGKSTDPLDTLIGKLNRFAKDANISVGDLSIKGLGEWLSEISRNNGIDFIYFIWDEFSEYFKNNKDRLTGFQELVELSETVNFSLVIITHNAPGLFNDKKEWKKVSDRFVSPVSKIELPESIAFKLIGHTIRLRNEKKDNERSQYNERIQELLNETIESRNAISERFKEMEEEDFEKMLPVHPLAALVLKNISSAFGSNQRSMLSFMLEKDSELRGFNYFIEHNEPNSITHPMLLVDDLWDYFYEYDNTQMSSEVSTILDSYRLNQAEEKLDFHEKEVYKTILLYDAIWEAEGKVESLLMPKTANIELAFNGTEVENEVSSTIQGLVREGFILEERLANNQRVYRTVSHSASEEEVRNRKENFLSHITMDKLLEQEKSISPNNFFTECDKKDFLFYRYNLKFVGVNNLDFEAKRAYSNLLSHKEKILEVVIVLAMEGDALKKPEEYQKLIHDYPGLIIIDATDKVLDQRIKRNYADQYSRYEIEQGKNNSSATYYKEQATKILNSEFFTFLNNADYWIYNDQEPGGTRYTGKDTVVQRLVNLAKEKFPLAPENNVQDPIKKTYLERKNKSASLIGAIKAGIDKEEKKGYTLLAEKVIKKENLIDQGKRNPSSYIYKLKQKVDRHIQDNIEKSGEQDLSELIDYFINEVGMIKSQLSAYIIGFLMGDYASEIDNDFRSESYNISDGNTANTLEISNLAKSLDDALKGLVGQRITKPSDKEKSFIKNSIDLFGLDKFNCSTIEGTKAEIRKDLSTRKYPFVILSTQENLDTISKKVIDKYCDLINNGKYDEFSNKVALEIGEIFQNNPDKINTIKYSFSDDSLEVTMKEYIDSYRDGEFSKALENIGEQGRELVRLQAQIQKTGDGNWIWRIESVNDLIDSLIEEANLLGVASKVLNNGTISKISDLIKIIQKKSSGISIPFEALEKQINPSLRELLTLFLNVCRLGSIRREDYSNYIEVFTNSGNLLNEFLTFETQFEYFKRIFKDLLAEVSSQEAYELFKNSPKDSFFMNFSDYRYALTQQIKDNQKITLRKELISIWEEITGTSSPSEWSKKYEISILYMVPEEEIEKARITFSLFDNKNAQTEEIRDGIDYLKSITFSDDINNTEKHKKIFEEKVLQDFKGVLNTDQVRKELSKENDPYFWYDNSHTVLKQVREMADHVYKESGYQKALNLIDEMSPDQVKDYLKRIIPTNVSLGIQILKEGVLIDEK